MRSGSAAAGTRITSRFATGRIGRWSLRVVWIRGPYRSNAVRLPDQDHRHIKSRTNVMLGFKRLRSAATTISGIELTHRISQGPVRSREARPQGCRCARHMECCPVQSIRYPAYRKLLNRLTYLHQIVREPARHSNECGLPACGALRRRGLDCALGMTVRPRVETAHGNGCCRLPDPVAFCVAHAAEARRSASASSTCCPGEVSANGYRAGHESVRPRGGNE